MNNRPVSIFFLRDGAGFRDNSRRVCIEYETTARRQFISVCAPWIACSPSSTADERSCRVHPSYLWKNYIPTNLAKNDIFRWVFATDWRENLRCSFVPFSRDKKWSILPKYCSNIDSAANFSLILLREKVVPSRVVFRWFSKNNTWLGESRPLHWKYWYFCDILPRFGI